MENHVPTCTCPDGYIGDPFNSCREAPTSTPKYNENPCSPSPCGPNSQCRNINDHAVCSCLQSYVGVPPQCRPECVVSSECAINQACNNQKCIDPCVGTCGLNARCEVKNHSPICSCPSGMTGDPFQRCIVVIAEPVEEPKTPRDPCLPTPCGPNSVCNRNGETPVCTCASGYFGNAPHCRPECVINTDCGSQQACVNQKCIDPCPGSCGVNAECRVLSHTVSCSCPVGYTGNSFVQCIIVEVESTYNYNNYYLKYLS